MKSPRRAGRSYTQLGNTGLGCVGFFLLCLSLSIFRVTSAGCIKKLKVTLFRKRSKFNWQIDSPKRNRRVTQSNQRSIGAGCHIAELLPQLFQFLHWHLGAGWWQRVTGGCGWCCIGWWLRPLLGILLQKLERLQKAQDNTVRLCKRKYLIYWS